jgi:hypothetical protein
MGSLIPSAGGKQVAPVKLVILAQDPSGNFKALEVRCMFNPAQLTQNKTVEWQEVPVMQGELPSLTYTKSPADTITLDLWFDTSEEEPGDKQNVRAETWKIYQLAMIQGSSHHPRVCQLQWGPYEPFFQGVVTSIVQLYTYFLENGTPVRAKLTVIFKGWSTEAKSKQEQKQSVDVHKTHTAKRGDTLSSIASTSLHDPARWRAIAVANGITDPFVLQPGRMLRIPTLTSR